MSNSDLVQPFPIIFPNGLIHKDIATAISEFIEKRYGETLQIVSAGECYISCSSVGGNSTTLNLYANTDDKATINTIDYFPYKDK